MKNSVMPQFIWAPVSRWRLDRGRIKGQTAVAVTVDVDTATGQNDTHYDRHRPTDDCHRSRVRRPHVHARDTSFSSETLPPIVKHFPIRTTFDPDAPSSQSPKEG
jgi:hypothetical protein